MPCADLFGIACSLPRLERMRDCSFIGVAESIGLPFLYEGYRNLCELPLNSPFKF